MLEAIIFVVFPFAMAFAALSDLFSMTIANRVSIILVATFLVVAPLTGMPVAEIGMHLLAGVVLLAATFALFAFGAMGGGDAKLISATAIWMGFGINLIYYLVVSAFAGGILTLAILIFRGSPMAVYAGQYEFMRKIGDKSQGIPYGIALGFGGLIAYPQSALALWAIERMSGN